MKRPPRQRREGEPEASVKDREALATLSDRLVAQRTAALREAAAPRPDIASIAVVHAFVVSTSTSATGRRVSI